MPCFRVEIDGYVGVSTGYEIVGPGESYRLTDDNGTVLRLSTPHGVRQLSPEPVLPAWYNPPQGG